MTDVHFFGLSAIAFGFGAADAFMAARKDMGWVCVGFCLLMLGIWLG